MTGLATSLPAQEAVVTPVPASANSAPGGKGGPISVGPDGKPLEVKPGQPVPGSQPGDPNAHKDPTKPAAPATPPPIMRGAEPRSPNRAELFKITPDADGKVTLNFHGQKWLDVLEWYAEIAGMSLDWQELPGDYLNLRTQRGYTVDEVRELLNRHLMDRGYTLLRHGEILVVANLKKLDPALVPRVRPEDLASREPHEFVKTSFKLDWLIAESTVEELKPMLSPHGKLTGLKHTNRLEAIDAVVNLREVYSVLKDEQSNRGQERLVREFKLTYTRADEVYDLLLGLLGQEKPKKDEGPMNPQQMMRMQQMMMQGGGQPGQPGQAAKPEKPKVHLMVNRRDNSVLANGPPDLIAICEQAVRIIDVPPEGDESLLQSAGRMRVYRLTSIDPEPLVETLNQIGNLDPETTLKIDKKNRSIIAYAPLVDHVTIKTLVDKLDGTDRRFEVIKLRRLDAEYVAGTIQFMMGAPEQKQQSRRSYYYYDPFEAYSGGSSNQAAEDLRKFRVDADVENNRLLIWANEVELAEIEKLLVKLGEIPAPGSRAATHRTIENIPLEDAQRLLERLRQSWPAVGDNPLQLDVQPPRKPRTSTDEEPPQRPIDNTRTEAPSVHVPTPPPSFQFSKASVSRTGENKDREVVVSGVSGQVSGKVEAVEAAGESDEDSGDAPFPPVTTRQRTSGRPPIDIELGPDGRWILRSDDTEALDRLEDLISELAPPKKDYRLFKLKHSSSWAYGIALTLEDFFKEQETKSTGRRPWFYYYDEPQQQTADSRRLSKRRQLKFIADSDSNSILVVGADNSQMRIIEELIDYYDQPLPSEAKALRKTKIFQIQYSKAKVIADVIKDVYRDLLSENDKALQQHQNGQNQNQQRASERTITYVYDNFGDGGSDKGKQSPPQPMRFKGAISVGVDELSNTITVSTTEGLMESITRMVEELDQAAKPTVPRMQVIQLDRSVPVEDLQAKLAKMLKEPKKEQPRQPPQPGQPQQPQVQQAEGNGPFGDE